MKIQNRTRAMMMAVVGAYVIYLAYKILRNGVAGKGDMSLGLSIFFSVLLGSGGIAVLILAWKTYKTEDSNDEKTLQSPEKPNDTDHEAGA